MRLFWFTQTRRVEHVGNANTDWQTRTSMLVVARARDGAYGIGEATPLPDYSPDTIEAVQDWLTKVDVTPLNLPASLSFAALLRQLEQVVPDGPPSGLLAVQTACLDLWSKRRATPLSDALRRDLRGEEQLTEATSAPPLHVAPLLNPNSPTLAQWVETCLDQGHTTFKVKIGTNPGTEAATLRNVESWARSCGRAVCFRLDANQSLAGATLALSLAPFEGLPIEYIEEPCPLPELVAGTLAFPLALDESLRLEAGVLRPWLSPGRLAALVCKPMLLGGVGNVLSWNAEAHRLGCPLVLSHLFDGPIAFALYRALATTLAPDTCHGLFPHAGLKLWSDRVYESAQSGLGLELDPAALLALHGETDST